MRKAESLQNFAMRIEAELKKGGTSLVLQVCRHIAGEDNKVSSFMTAKCVEWMLGKPKERVEVTGTIEHEHFDYSAIRADTLEELRRIAEDKLRSGDRRELPA